MHEPTDEEVADSLLTDDERDEVAHIQKHFEEASEQEKALFGWRATSIYLGAFQREIARLRQQNGQLVAGHASHDCACGHDEKAHRPAIVCETCRFGEEMRSDTEASVTH